MVPAIPRILARVRQATDYALATRPDALVVIDSPDFTHRVARAIKVMFGLDTAGAPEGQPVDENIVNMAKKLRDSGYLTRDGRMKERKKYGRKGARKSFQFSKR